MKILELTTNISEGSVARIVKDLYGVIEDAGHECLIAYGRGACNKEFKSLRIGNSLDVYIHALLTRITDRAGFYSKRVTKRFIKEIEGYQPDIIHIHCLHGYYINIPQIIKYIEEKEIPVVWTFHDCWAFTGHCAYFDNCGCEKWKQQCLNCQQKKSFPTSYFLDNSRKNYLDKKKLFSNINNLTIVTPSKWLEEVVNNSFFCKKKVVTINNGIDTDCFKYTPNKLREKYNLIGKKIILGVAGVWNERKGLDTFLKLSDILEKEYQVVLVGIDSKDIGDYSQKVITIKKTQNKEELAQWYSVADIFVNPTLEDNYPTVNLEAIACGTPVITYDTGGSGECLKFGNGILVEKGDFDELVTGIKKLCIEEEPKNVHSNRIDKKYCFDQYINLFKEILHE